MDEQEMESTEEILEQIIEEFHDEPSPEGGEGGDPESAAAPEPAEPPEEPEEPEAPAAAAPAKRRPWLYYTLIAIFSAVFLCCAVYIGSYLVEIYQAAKKYDELASMVQQARETQPSETVLPTFGTATNPDPDSTEPEETDPPTILAEYQAIYELNNDLVGWITVPGTKVNYPVLQSSVENKDYYLYRDIYGDESRMGAIYVRETCDVFTPSDNVTIYGHCMKTGEMFGNLSSFTSKSFWEKYQYITFDTIYEHHTYQIFAVFKTSANLDEGFAYHQFENAADAEEFDAFVAKVKELSYYDTGITPVYGDKLICLSTCEYTLDNGRLVVAAVRVS